MYCSKYPNSEFSVSRFDDAQGNIRFKRINHTWKNGKCIFCGVTQKESTYTWDEMEVHAYEWVHIQKPEEIFDMKFDVIISNPPYQLSTGGGTEESKSATQAKPVYNKFIEQAKKLNPRFITMIVPTRWYNGGMGLNQFRIDMLNDKRIVKLVDYLNSKDCFQGVDIAGGVCYFLWDRDHPNDECEIINISGEELKKTVRSLNEFETMFIRSNEAIQIINKVKSKCQHLLQEIK